MRSSPRWEEAAVYYVQFNGAPTSAYDPYSSGDGSDPSSRSCWADWEHPRGEDAVYVSWHSNAGGGAGTDVFWYDGSSGTAYPGSRDLAELAQEELVSSARTLWTSSWGDRGARGYALSEINPSLNDEMPAILIEHGFHDNETDIAYIKHPRFRRDSARAIARLRPEHIRADRGIIQVHAGKGAKDRQVPLSPVLLAELRAWWVEARPEGGWLFPGAVPGAPITSGTIQNHFHKARRAAGLREGLTFHSLRRSFATHQLEAKVDLATVQAALGHASLETSLRYIRLRTDHLVAAGTPLDRLQGGLDRPRN